MENIESKQGRIRAGEERVYNFLTDIRNLDKLIPSDKVQDWESSEDSCSFSIPQYGSIKLRITEKEPNRLIKIEPEGPSPMGFSFYIQMKEAGPDDTRIKLTFRAEMNPMIKAMIKGPLQRGLDQIVDTVENIPLGNSNQ